MCTFVFESKIRLMKVLFKRRDQVGFEISFARRFHLFWLEMHFLTPKNIAPATCGTTSCFWYSEKNKKK